MGGLKAEDYLQQLLALLPNGLAWNKQTDSNLYLFCEGLAQEFARIEADLDLMLKEAKPNRTWNLLKEWEKAAGLPDECVVASDDPVVRRNQLVSRLLMQGGQSVAYFVSVLEGMGYKSPKITEPKPATVNSLCTAFVWDKSSAWSWIVSLSEDVDLLYATTNSACTAFLGAYMPSPAKCLLERIKPAHTYVSVRYVS